MHALQVPNLRIQVVDAASQLFSLSVLCEQLVQAKSFHGGVVEIFVATLLREICPERVLAFECLQLRKSLLTTLVSEWGMHGRARNRRVRWGMVGP